MVIYFFIIYIRVHNFVKLSYIYLFIYLPSLHKNSQLQNLTIIKKQEEGNKRTARAINYFPLRNKLKKRTYKINLKSKMRLKSIKIELKSRSSSIIEQGELK